MTIIITIHQSSSKKIIIIIIIIKSLNNHHHYHILFFQHDPVILEKLKKLEIQAELQEHNSKQEAQNEGDSEVIEINVTDEMKDDAKPIMMGSETSLRRGL